MMNPQDLAPIIGDPLDKHLQERGCHVEVKDGCISVIDPNFKLNEYVQLVPVPPTLPATESLNVPGFLQPFIMHWR